MFPKNISYNKKYDSEPKHKVPTLQLKSYKQDSGYYNYSKTKSEASVSSNILAKEKNNLAVFDSFNKKEIIRKNRKELELLIAGLKLYRKALLKIKYKYFHKTTKTDFNNDKKL